MQGMTPLEKDLAAANGGQTAALIQQLHGLIRLLQTHPELPLSPYASSTVQVTAADCDEVDRAAAALGVKADWNDDRTCYSTGWNAGPNVAYRVVWHVPGYITAFSAHLTAFHPARPELAEVAAA